MILKLGPGFEGHPQQRSSSETVILRRMTLQLSLRARVTLARLALKLSSGAKAQ
jgi:hypothetical protein